MNRAGSAGDVGPGFGFSLTGRTALVTGASRNIGAALAAGFARAGADLVLAARGAERLDAVADGIRAATDRRVVAVALDVSEPTAADRLLAAGETLGGVDVLVNNAYAAGHQLPALTADDDAAELAWERAVAVNLLAPARLARAFGRRMIADGGGCILNVVSGSALQVSAGLAVYGATKAALWTLTRYLAAEAAPTVRVNALCPGLVSEDGLPRSDAQRALIDRVPMNRVGRPEEMVGAALYLCSDAASYTTGELLVANGGRPW